MNLTLSIKNNTLFSNDSNNTVEMLKIKNMNEK